MNGNDGIIFTLKSHVSRFNGYFVANTCVQ